MVLVVVASLAELTINLSHFRYISVQSSLPSRWANSTVLDGTWKRRVSRDDVCSGGGGEGEGGVVAEGEGAGAGGDVEEGGGRVGDVRDLVVVVVVGG